MTRALVTQMLEAMEPVSAYGLPGTKDVQQTKLQDAIKAAREYLATEPSGERAELIAELRERHGKRFVVSPSMFSRAADMLEADAQQAKRVPISDGVIAVITDACFQAVADQGTTVLMRAVARAIEAHHGITPAEKLTDWSAA